MGKTYTYLATSDEMSDITGKYFDEKNRLVTPSKYSTDPENIDQVVKLTLGFIDQESAS